uniref:Uncharacterized protein n=1 Tax=Fagus sylvatica TaxID=28930 RepID=A0A2N9GVJ5_FAGSY
MMWRSKDHRSAGLWWSLLSSGGCLGGYGRLLKSFQPLIVAFVSAGDAVDHSVTNWRRRRRSFSVTEFGVDRWVIHRGPLGNLPWTTGQRGGPASFLLFLFLISATADHFLWNLSLMIRWAGFPFFFWALGLADGFLAISFHVLSTVGYWACWALDLWWITEVCGGARNSRFGVYQSMRTSLPDQNPNDTHGKSHGLIWAAADSLALISDVGDDEQGPPECWATVGRCSCVAVALAAMAASSAFSAPLLSSS